MKQIVLVAHGKLAHEMKNSAKMIFGQVENVTSIEFLVGEGLETVIEKIDSKVTEQDAIILCDLFSGTPYNAACAYAMKNNDKNIQVVSGMSLPIVLEVAAMIDTNTLEEIVDHIMEVAPDTIRKFNTNEIEEEDEL